MTKQGLIPLDDEHSMYFKVEGRGYIPLVVVHGGPGACMNLAWCGFFNLQLFQLIFFDQRGCGQSKPYGSLHNNTLDQLVEDMEKLRQYCDVKHWIVFGDSWGTTLSIAYGCKYPQNCMGFILRGVFLGRPLDVEFCLWTTRLMFPEAHGHLLDLVEKATGKRPADCAEMIKLCNQAMLHSPLANDVARAWAGYEALISTAEPDEASDDVEDVSDAVTLGLIECHYYMPNAIPNLLKRVRETPELTKLPCWIAHGRLDLVCPITQAIELHNVWPASKLAIIPGAGHYSFERANRAVLFQFADELEHVFGPRSGAITNGG